MRRACTLLVALLVLGGCGVEPQPEPQPLTLPAPLPSPTGQRSGEVGLEVTVFFVRGTGLVPARRTVEGGTPAEALTALTAGPRRAEVIAGVRTALAPQPLSVDVGLPGGLTSVTVTQEFAGISGGNQLLAVAQVVWTLTELEGTQRVRFLVDGAPVEVPTDSGLTEGPVSRENFLSVAPPESADPSDDD